MPAPFLDPKRLPDIPSLQQRAKALAMIDAIVCPDWEYRRYSYNCKWGDGQEMSSMRDGSGDDWFLWFGSVGAAIKGLMHESPLARDNDFRSVVRRSVPETFGSFLNEPAFGWERLSFCFWRETGGAHWSRAEHTSTHTHVDGSLGLLALLVHPAKSYVDFANEYYERELPKSAVEALFDHQPLTQKLVSALNSELAVIDVAADTSEIGYPVSA